MSEHGAATPPTSFARSAHKFSRGHTAWFLAAFYGLAVAWGIRSIRPEQPSAMDSLMPIASSIALGWWAIVDARRAHRPIPVLGRPWFFFFAAVLVPGYVLWTRRWRGLAWLALCAVTWFVLAMVVMYVGGVIAFGDQWSAVGGGDDAL